MAQPCPIARALGFTGVAQPFRAACVAHQLVHERAHAALRHQRRIQVPHRARGGIAGVRELRLAGVLHLAVEPVERRAREVHLAADLDAIVRPASQRERDRADRAHVRGDLLTARAVAARRRAQQASAFVRERNAQAVDFQLGDVGDLLEPGALAHALVEGAQLLLGVRVVETEHRHHVLDGVKAFDRAACHALRRRVGRDELRMLRFNPLELVEQPIELLVGDLGVVVDVVALFVMPDRIAQLAKSPFDAHQKPAGTTKARWPRRRTKKTNPYLLRVVLVSLCLRGCICFLARHRTIRQAVERRPQRFARDLGERAVRRQAEQDETNQTKRGHRRGVRANHRDHGTGAIRDRKAADPGAERRKRGRRDVPRLGQGETIPRGGG